MAILHYDETKDVYCHTCITGFKEGKMRSPHADPTLVSKMFDCDNQSSCTYVASYVLCDVADHLPLKSLRVNA